MIGVITRESINQEPVPILVLELEQFKNWKIHIINELTDIGFIVWVETLDTLIIRKDTVLVIYKLITTQVYRCNSK